MILTVLTRQNKKEVIKLATQTQFITAEEVQRVMGIGQTSAYTVIKTLNKQLKAKGCVTVSGRCPRKFFEEMTMYDTGGQFNPTERKQENEEYYQTAKRE